MLIVCMAIKYYLTSLNKLLILLKYKNKLINIFNNK